MISRTAATHALTTTLAAAALLTALTACSDDNGSGEDRAGTGGRSGEATDRPEETRTEDPAADPDEDPDDNPDEGTTESPAPPDDGIERPEVRVADDLEMIFEEPDPGDPFEQEVLTDNEQHIRAVYEVITTHRADLSAVEFYAREQALGMETSYARSLVGSGVAAAGVMRFYDREVNEVGDGVAEVIFCRSFPEVYFKDFDSGEVVQPANPDALPTHYVARLERNGAGVWQAVSTEMELSSPDC